MSDTTTSHLPGRSSGLHNTARIQRRAHSAAVVRERRMQLAYDGATGSYQLAML